MNLLEQIFAAFLGSCRLLQHQRAQSLSVQNERCCSGRKVELRKAPSEALSLRATRVPKLPLYLDFYGLMCLRQFTQRFKTHFVLPYLFHFLEDSFGVLYCLQADNPARLRRAVQQGKVGTVRRFIRDKKASETAMEWLLLVLVCRFCSPLYLAMLLHAMNSQFCNMLCQMWRSVSSL